MKTVKDKINEVKDQAASEALTVFNQTQASKSRDGALLLLGGIKATQAQAESNYAQSMRALEYFAREKHYETLGFKDFATFLDQSEYSPMTKHEYYNRVKLLSTEGDETFNLMTSLKVSLATRRALKKGEIIVEGDLVRIGDEEIPVTETARIKSILKTLADKTAEQKQTIERGKKELKAKQQQLDEAQANGQGDGPRATQDFDSLATQAYLTALSALNDLEAACKKLPAAQHQAYLKEFQSGLELAFQNWTLYANGMKAKAIGVPETPDEIDALFDAEISDDAFTD